MLRDPCSMWMRSCDVCGLSPDESPVSGGARVRQCARVHVPTAVCRASRRIASPRRDGHLRPAAGREWLCARNSPTCADGRQADRWRSPSESSAAVAAEDRLSFQNRIPAAKGHWPRGLLSSQSATTRRGAGAEPPRGSIPACPAGNSPATREYPGASVARCSGSRRTSRGLRRSSRRRW